MDQAEMDFVIGTDRHQDDVKTVCDCGQQFAPTLPGSLVVTLGSGVVGIDLE
jgi:hypothetical protein